MDIVVACGGTGGHAFPGLAVAEELRRRGHDVTVWDSGRDVESSVMRNWTGKAFSTGAKQLSLGNVFSNIHSYFRCRREMRKRQPAVLLAMGSYSSLPPTLAAAGCGVPTVLHEANTVPGKAVEFLSRFAKVVATSFAETAERLPNVKTVQTGLPVRAGIAEGKRFPFVPNDAFTVFVTGGSQGAHAINELMCDALAKLKDEIAKTPGGRPLYVIHQTGVRDEGLVMAAYAKAGIPARVVAFEDEMANAFATADFVVARAGASTCFELAACAKPSLLIPLPTALRNHQHFNADAFASRGAADEGLQKDLTPEQLAKYLVAMRAKPERLAEMSRRAAALAVPDAAARVADLVEKTARRPLANAERTVLQ